MAFSKITLNGATLMDVTQDTVSSSTVLSGEYATGPDGVRFQGTYVPSGPSPTPTPTETDNDVIFVDYDGTIIASYSKNDFLNLQSLPANPSHDGLTAEGWNWTLSDAKTQVTKYGKLTIGQMYITTDGATKIYIEFPNTAHDSSLIFTVQYSQTVSQGVLVDWGDGNSETFSGTSSTQRSHTYSTPGAYLVTLTVNSGKISFGGSSSSYTILGNINAVNYFYRMNLVKKVFFGDNITSLGNYTLYSMHQLEFVTIPEYITSLGTNFFQADHLLKCVVIPSSVTLVSSGCFNTCCSLIYVSLPKGITQVDSYAFQYNNLLKNLTTFPDAVTSIGTYAFQYCYNLESFTLPSNVTSLAGYVFKNCYALKSITFSDKITSIGAQTFQYCYGLKSIDIPNTVTSIGQQAFSCCYNLESINFSSSVATISSTCFERVNTQSVTLPSTVTDIGNSAFTNVGYLKIHIQASTPPTLGTGVFSTVGLKIYVPSASLDSYKAATNWSTYANYMEGE